MPRRNKNKNPARSSSGGSGNAASSAPQPTPTPIRRRTDREVPPQHVETHVAPYPGTAAAAQAGGTRTSPPPASVASSHASAHHAAPPSTTAQRTRRQPSKQGEGIAPRLWRRLLGLMFQREDFVDFDGSFGGPMNLADVSVTQKRTARYVEGLPISGWMKHILFDLFDFFTRKRVYFVVAVLAVLAFSIMPPGTLDDMAGTFTVDESSRPGLTFFKKYNNGSSHLPGRHPVAIMPGFITGALEVWETSLPCVRDKSFFSGFRQRMFGPQMLYLILSDPLCWLDLFGMNTSSGLDKKGSKIRADLGFAAIDYFVPGYWVWAKVLINLADIGYDPQSMAVMSYDWRLSPQKTHERDGFFYMFRNNLRFLCQKNRRRAVVISHSYGATVALAFFRWADKRETGFMDRHVAYYINIGGTTMGIAKAASALLFGDAKDTLAIPGPARKALDTFVSQEARYTFMRTWTCLAAMLPRGCEEAWPGLATLPNGTSLNARGTAELIREECRRSGHEACVREVGSLLETIDDLPSLPQAPRTTVACLYGVGIPAEVGYHLMYSETGGGKMSYVANNSVFSNDTIHGVRLSDGDETVPLMSLAYMCRAVNGWSRNVGRVITREFNHTVNAASMNLRGGQQSSKHVDILGNYEMLESILKIASGVDEQGAEPGQDEFQYTDDKTNETVTLQRRVHDRIYSDVDFLIRRNLRTCLRKKNKPIMPLPPQEAEEDNEFVWSGMRTTPQQQEQRQKYAHQAEAAGNESDEQRRGDDAPSDENTASPP